jgi:PleD family two-component response regulator
MAFLRRSARASRRRPRREGIRIGVGTIVPSAEDNPLHFIEAVDKCLYRAKQAGRSSPVAQR